MNDGWQIHYSNRVLEVDIPRLDKTVRTRIGRTIHEKLTRDPLRFGKPLRYSLSGQRSLRVGDYRMIYHIEPTARYVNVVAIDHRRDVYE